MWTALQPVMIAAGGGILWAIGFRRIPILAWLLAIALAGEQWFKLW
jgi:hypothetical protein